MSDLRSTQDLLQTMWRRLYFVCLLWRCMFFMQTNKSVYLHIKAIVRNSPSKSKPHLKGEKKCHIFSELMIINEIQGKKKFNLWTEHIWLVYMCVWGPCCLWHYKADWKIGNHWTKGQTYAQFWYNRTNNILCFIMSVIKYDNKYCKNA